MDRWPGFADRRTILRDIVLRQSLSPAQALWCGNRRDVGPGGLGARPCVGGLERGPLLVADRAFRRGRDPPDGGREHRIPGRTGYRPGRVGSPVPGPQQSSWEARRGLCQRGEDRDQGKHQRFRRHGRRHIGRNPDELHQSRAAESPARLPGGGRRRRPRRHLCLRRVPAVPGLHGGAMHQR